MFLLLFDLQFSLAGRELLSSNLQPPTLATGLFFLESQTHARYFTTCVFL